MLLEKFVGVSDLSLIFERCLIDRIGKLYLGAFSEIDCGVEDILKGSETDI